MRSDRPLRAAPAALVLTALVLTAGCSGVRVARVPAPVAVERPATFDHGAFDALLKRYVDAAGLVDYAGLRADRAALNGYLARLAATDPSAMPEPERLAFWINAYNANTLKLIADNYPTRSILRLTPVAFPGLALTIPNTNNSPFKVRFARVAGRTMTLDEIEHGTIRADFREPRIHAALVCAAMSCPPLRREAYTGQNLDAQLTDQMRTWLRDRSKNRVPDGDGTEIGLSQIFKWFQGDFGGSDETVQRFIAPYFDAPVRATLERGGYRTGHRRYDWTLNDQRLARDAPKADAAPTAAR